MEAPPFEQVLAALHSSHERLAGALAPLSAEQVGAQSYDDDWSLAQVASHLGSGAEIFTLFLDAGLHGEPAPGIEKFKSVWVRWNDKSAYDQATDAVKADAAFLDRLDTLSDTERQRWRLDLFGTDQRAADFVRMRLAEHAVHTWDIVVALDGDATVAADAVPLLIDMMDGLVARVGKPTEPSLRLAVRTENPERSFVLELDADGSRLKPAAVDAAELDRELRLPAEALIRLVYGRLDPDHTPPLEADQLDLETLRRAFPGL